MRSYLRNVWLALDQLLNALTGGDPDETVSSRCGRRLLATDCRLCGALCRMLDVFWPDHCIHNIIKDRHGPTGTKD